MMRWPRAWVGIVIAFVGTTPIGCGGSSLDIGSDKLSTADAATPPCDAPPGKIVPGLRSIDENLPAAISLLVGRWRLCPTSPHPAGIDAVVEMTRDTGFALIADGAGGYRRADAGVPLRPAWSLRHDSLVIAFPEASTTVLFEDAPLRMTWNGGFVFAKE